MLRKGSLATKLAKIALNATARVDVDSGLLSESLAQAIGVESPEKAEGTAAFLEQREPRIRQQSVAVINDAAGSTGVINPARKDER